MQLSCVRGENPLNRISNSTDSRKGVISDSFVRHAGIMPATVEVSLPFQKQNNRSTELSLREAVPFNVALEPRRWSAAEPA